MTKHHKQVQAIIAAALVNYPDLGTYGFGQGVGEAFDAQQVHTAIEFLRMCGPGRATMGSYHLKHVAERWGRTVGLAPYITNGAMIVAAHGVAFSIKRNAPYGVIGVNARGVDKICERLRRQQERQAM